MPKYLAQLPKLNIFQIIDTSNITVDSQNFRESSKSCLPLLCVIYIQISYRCKGGEKGNSTDSLSSHWIKETGRCSPGTHRKGDWVGPGDSLDVMAKVISWPCG